MTGPGRTAAAEPPKESQPVGPALPHWSGAATPPGYPLIGQRCRLDRLSPAQHSADLYRAFSVDREQQSWTYLPYGPFTDAQAFRAWMERTCTSDDPLFYAIRDGTGKPTGMLSLMRTDPPNGVTEVGHVHLAPVLRRTPAATEAFFLVLGHVFDDLGYRRVEWKCDSLNAPSRAAARRLGFTFEGVFRQALVVKGRNRDTAWFSMLDLEWPQVRRHLLEWLDPDNFDDAGRQRKPLRRSTP